MKNRCALFDLDGTLLDSLGDIADAVNFMRRSLALAPLPEATVKGYIGDGIEQLVERAIAGTGADFAAALKLTREYYQSHVACRTRLYPGVKAGLDVLKNVGFKLGVVTNKPEKAAFEVLAKLGIAEYFDGIAAGGGKYPLKPAPDGCRALVRQLDGDPAASYMIGDHYADLGAAAGAGIHGVFARWGFGDPRGEKIDFAAENFEELVKILTQNT